MVAKQFGRFMRRKGKRSLGIYESRRKGESSSKKDIFRKSLEKKKDPKKDARCFECGDKGHFKAKFPKLKKDMRQKKKAMVATWSESEESSCSSSSEEEEVGHCDFVATTNPEEE